MSQEAKEYYKRKNLESRIQGWVTLYIVIGIVVNGILTGGHWIFGTFMSPLWPMVVVGHIFGIDGWGG